MKRFHVPHAIDPIRVWLHSQARERMDAWQAKPTPGNEARLLEIRNRLAAEIGIVDKEIERVRG